MRCFCPAVSYKNQYTKMIKILIYKQKINFKQDIDNSIRKSEAIISNKENKSATERPHIHHLT